MKKMNGVIVLMLRTKKGLKPYASSLFYLSLNYSRPLLACPAFSSSGKTAQATAPPISAVNSWGSENMAVNLVVCTGLALVR